jgi:multiple sugar transport system permease protein
MLLLPSIILLVGLVFYPLYFAWKNSFFYWNLETSPIPLQFVGLGNFRNIFTFTPFIPALINTLLFAVAGVLIEFYLGFAIALALATRLPRLNIVRSLLIMPTTVAPIVSGFIFLYIYYPDGGIINWIADIFNVSLPVQGLLGDQRTALISILAVDVWQWTPFFALVLYAAIISVSPEILEASEIDGANYIQKIRFITLPTIKPIAAIIVMLQFMRIFNTFDVVYVLTKGGPGTATHTLSYVLYVQGLKNFNIGVAAALTIFIVLTISIITLVYSKIALRNQEW